MTGKVKNKEPAIPSALRELLIRVRAAIKETRSMNPDIRVSVSVGWPELHAVYSLTRNIKAVRVSRDKLKLALRQTHSVLDSRNADSHAFELLSDRAVLRLLVDIERSMSGKETRPELAFQAHSRLKDLIRRAKRRKSAL